MKAQRLARIDHEIQRILGTLISQELKDPRLGFVTVTRVEVGDDLRTCKVFVSVIGDRHQARQSLEALQSGARFLRGELGHRIDLRHTPELTFIEDRSTERAIALAKTLREDAERRKATQIEGDE
ncbi:MAG: 30S ribosome-binding factor RbfA [Candidatus Aquilonibacter sp.]